MSIRSIIAALCLLFVAAWVVAQEALPTAELPAADPLAGAPPTDERHYSYAIGLQIGKISNDSMTEKWDGTKRPMDDWSQDQERARWIGKDTMQFWLDSLKYGVQDKKEKVVIGSAIDTFWLDNSLKISPDQELEIGRAHV